MVLRIQCHPGWMRSEMEHAERDLTPDLATVGRLAGCRLAASAGWRALGVAQILGQLDAAACAGHALQDALARWRAGSLARWTGTGFGQARCGTNQSARTGP